eukprot:11169841-Lingulodinium_polyedra.AAC.1
MSCTTPSAAKEEVLGGVAQRRIVGRGVFREPPQAVRHGRRDQRERMDQLEGVVSARGGGYREARDQTEKEPRPRS